MDRKMTDDEIIKAMEYCVSVNSCNDCKISTPRPCTTLETKDILDLIKRKDAKIENVRKVWNDIVKDKFKTIYKQSAEIERLKNAYKQCAWERDTFLEQLKPAKIESIKEFAEKFKKKAGSIVTSCQGYEIYETKQYQISAINFDNLVKEMTENITKIEHNSLCETETYKGGEL